jgi:hypothetical protein
MWESPIVKHKNKRIKNQKKIKVLQESIFDRENDKCVLCHRWVSRAEKFHHQRFGIYKQDRIECGAVLCYQCHQDLHFGNNSKQLQNEVELYLAGLYPAFWESEYNVYV